MKSLAAMVVLLGACDAGAPKPDCGKAAHAVAEIARSGKPGGLSAKVKNDLITSCADGKWSPEAVACIRASTSDQGLRECRRTHLTGEQAKAFDKITTALAGDGDTMEQAIARFEGFAEDMCACKDTTCATRVSDEIQAWGKEVSERMKPLPAPDMDTQKRVTELGRKMADCMTKAMGTTGPTP